MDAVRRRFLLGMAAILLLLGAAVVAKMLWWTPGNYEGAESLHGIAIGDTAESIGGKVALTRVDAGNPWTLRDTKEHLGRVLEKSDLGLKDVDLALLKIAGTLDNKLVVLFHQDKVIAVVTSDRSAKTARELKMGDNVGKMNRLYPEGFDAHDETLQDKTHVGIYRYPALGIAFEVQSGRITGMTLFPPVKTGEPGS